METLTIIEVLRGSDVDELHQIASFINNYQNCDFVEPANVNSRICWIISIQQMIIQKEPGNPIHYAARIKSIVRWFLEHNIDFTIPQYSFFRWMSRAFTYTITDTNIRLENRFGRVFHISREEMDLSRFERQIENDPTNSLFTFLDEDYNEGLTISEPSDERTEATIPPHRSLLDIIDEEITDETRTLECKICTINKICVALTRCGHTFCHSCTTRFEGRCATCRTPFTDETKIRIYI